MFFFPVTNHNGGITSPVSSYNPYKGIKLVRKRSETKMSKILSASNFLKFSHIIAMDIVQTSDEFQTVFELNEELLSIQYFSGIVQYKTCNFHI